SDLAPCTPSQRHPCQRPGSARTWRSSWRGSRSRDPSTRLRSGTSSRKQGKALRGALVASPARSDTGNADSVSARPPPVRSVPPSPRWIIQSSIVSEAPSGDKGTIFGQRTLHRSARGVPLFRGLIIGEVELLDPAVESRSGDAQDLGGAGLVA